MDADGPWGFLDTPVAIGLAFRARRSFAADCTGGDLMSTAVRRAAIADGRVRACLALFTLVLMVWTISFEPPIGPKIVAGLTAFQLSKVVIRVLVVGLFGLFAISVWLHGRRRGALSLYLPLAVYTTMAAASVFWSPLPKISLGQAISLAALVSLSLGFAVVCRSRDDVRWVLRLVCVSLLATCCFGLAIHFGKPDLASIGRGTGDGLLHPTNSAATACLGLVLTVASSLIWGWKWARRLLAPALIVFPTVIAIALNRWGPAVSIMVLAGLFACFANRTVVAVGAVTISLAAAVYLAFDPGLVLAGGGVDAVGSVSSRGQTTQQIRKLSGREEMWRAILDSHAEAPWIGHGFFVTSKTGKLDVWGEAGNRTAHNFHLQVLVSMGRLGLALLLAALLYPMYQIFRGLRGRCGDGRLLVFFALMLLWYAAWGVFNESIAGPLTPESVVFFSLLGLAVGVADRRRRVSLLRYGT